MELSKPQMRNDNIVTIDAENETLVYDLTVNKAHCLNETARFVWKNCDGKKTAAEIQAMAVDEFGAAVPDDFVWLALAQLKESDLLLANSAGSIKGINRREVLKRVGMASVVALPIIASMVAPRNAYANASCACTETGTLNAPTCAVNANSPCNPNCSPLGQCVP